VARSVCCAPLGKRDAHLAILRRIPGEALFATLWNEAIGSPVACGLAVVGENLVGLFDIVTERTVRHQGYGTALVTKLLNRSISGGAHAAYLQVVAENGPAVSLYRKLGFRDAYHYWYRIPADFD
jgi:ribosomal protein S18 acetylase RimI-like enzyme